MIEHQPAIVARATFRSRASRALRQRHNWEQLGKFCVVGVSGYAVNLAVYAILLNAGNLHYAAAATGSFLVAVTNNYVLNRVWILRKLLSQLNTVEAMEFLHDKVRGTKVNQEFLDSMNQ